MSVKRPNKKIYFIFSDEESENIWGEYEKRAKANGKQRMYLRQDCFVAGMKQLIKEYKGPKK